MPLPTDVAQADAARTRSGRWKMLAMMLVCAAPVMASYITFYLVKPQSTRNYGMLIAPVRDLPTVDAKNLDGQTVALSSLKGQWLLVVVASGVCDEPCQKNLYFQRQLRETLGKDKDRVDRVWLVDDEAPVAENVRPALSQAHVLRVDRTVLQTWLEAAPGSALQDHVYVVDPMGNWMMRFPAHMDVASATKAKKDLERLLRASASWDQAGR